METFFLGTHEPDWLGKTDVPLFVSVRRLMRRKRLPQAKGIWACDSGGFTELSLHGQWTIPVKTYIEEVRRYMACIGRLQWASVQDYMTEPTIRAKTGLSVAEHQQRTIDSYQQLVALAPEVPWAPVLQGWELTEYWRHQEAYAKAGIDLKAAPAVGVGSICRRQSSTRANALIATLYADGLNNLHAYGYKTRGLALAHQHLQSSDSLAWSYRARRSAPLPECAHSRCVNCLAYALRWRRKLLQLLGKEEPPRRGIVQGQLFQRSLFP